jgi:hypothetical protein
MNHAIYLSVFTMTTDIANLVVQVELFLKNIYETLGRGYPEVVYRKSLEFELQSAGMYTTAFGGSAAVMVACGWNHSMVVTADGRLWTFGRGREGQVGRGNKPKILVPRIVWYCSFNEVKIVMVAGGRYHSIATTADGDVYVTLLSTCWLVYI